MSALLDRIKKNSSIKETSLLAKSPLFNEKDNTVTSIPALNIAASGDLDKGFTSGLTLFAGKSKHFKTLFTLIYMKSYLDKHKDGVAVFFDSEFGTPTDYFKSVGIDVDRVLHIPIKNLEELKFECMKVLEDLTKGEKLFIAVDSLGNLASKKELEDALNEKSVGDMTRAKQTKSLFRMVTPYLTMKDVPMVCVAHTYDSQEMFSKAVVSGGSGLMYSSDTVFIVGRQQEKEGSDLAGYNFVLNVEKSRYVKEKSKIPVTVKFEGGLDKYSGLLDIALELGFVTKPKVGWYQKMDPETGEMLEKLYRAKDTGTKDFWQPLLESKQFKEAVSNKFKVSYSSLMAEEEILAETE
jgi:RecA/RadA recombinase